jgi:hypothetical protein
VDEVVMKSNDVFLSWFLFKTSPNAFGRSTVKVQTVVQKKDRQYKPRSDARLVLPTHSMNLISGLSILLRLLLAGEIFFLPFE